MKAHTSSCSKFFAEKGSNRGFFCPGDQLSRVEACFLKTRGFVVVRQTRGLISLRHKAIRPVSSSSSSSSPKAPANLDAAETQTQDLSTQDIIQSKTVHVKFKLQRECLFGEQFFIVGDDPTFGLWDPASAIPLDWSDEHVWTVEMDIPIGKSIQFKFLLKANNGKIVWQPGPDRILQTWETMKMITVFEDWENVEFQKIVEEEPVLNLNEESNFSSDMPIVAENVTLEESAAADSNINSIDKPVVEAQKELIVAESITQSQEKPKTMVAENITYPRQEAQVNANDKAIGAKSITYPEEKPVAISNNNMVVEDSIPGNKGKATKTKDPGNTTEKENSVNVVGVPVLVPGLTPLPVDSTEEATSTEDDKSISTGASSGASEAKTQNEPELLEKREPEVYPHQEDTTEMLFNEEVGHDIELNQNPLFAKEEDQDESVPDNDVIENNIKWGRKTLQKFLVNLGLI